MSEGSANAEYPRAGSPGDVKSDWVKGFRVQMARQRAAEADIDRALADVRAHCAESGQSAREAFGDPAEYATVLAAELPAPAKQSAISGRSAAFLVPIAMALAVLAVSLAAPTGRPDTAVTLGQLLTVVIAAPLWAVVTLPIPRFTPRDPAVPHRRAFDERGLRGLLAVAGLIAAGAVLWLLFDDPVVTVPRWSLTTVVAVLFAVSFFPRFFPAGSPDRQV
jgi:hypothetical protein